MNTEERLWADYRGTGLTIGRHPMAYRRAEMNALGVTRAADLARVPDGRLVRIAGSVIVRQRPGTAKGFVFLSMEDETGIMNAIVDPRHLRPLQIRSAGRALPADRWRAAKPGRRDFGESRAHRGPTGRRRGGVARFSLNATWQTKIF